MSPETLRMLIELRNEAGTEAIVENSTAKGRLAELRRKYQSYLGQKSVLLPGFSEEEMAAITKPVGLFLPDPLMSLYLAVGGESESGFFASGLAFTRFSQAVDRWQAQQLEIQSGLLPRFLEDCLQIFSDGIGNGFLAPLGQKNSGSPILYVDFDSLEISVASSSLDSLLRRLIEARAANKANSSVCPGDFRSLSLKEIELFHQFEPVFLRPADEDMKRVRIGIGRRSLPADFGKKSVILKFQPKCSTRIIARSEKAGKMGASA